MRTFIFILVFAISGLGHAEGPETGGGAGLGQLEGFENFRAISTKLQNAISASVSLVKGFGLEAHQDLPELKWLAQEIEFSKYILVPRDVTLSANSRPGDYSIGTFLVASTDLQRGAPTKIYPRLFDQLSDSQLIQMVIHEGLHRALPEPMNGLESACDKITNILTQYSENSVEENLKNYFNVIRNKKIPWIVYVEDKNSNYNRAKETQAIIDPLISDNTIVESFASETRITIRVYYYYRSNYFQISVRDEYRNIVYKFASSFNYLFAKAPNFKDYYAGKNYDNWSEITKATDFLRNTIARIESDLKM